MYTQVKYTPNNNKMKDIFDNKILCNKCNKQMSPQLITKNGFNLRILKCPKCSEIIIHPSDEKEYQGFMNLKQKEFNMKMRRVGNSYTVSIPRQIVDFMQEQETLVDNMVKLCFERAGQISMNFNTESSDEDEESSNSRIIKSREVRVVKDNKIIHHAKQFYDSAHPEKSQTKIIKSSEDDR